MEYKVNLDAFRRELDERGELFLLYGAIPADKVELQFEGHLDGVPVVWNACVRTIKEYSRHNTTTEDPMQFIEVDVVKGAYLLEVALNITQIDKSALERTIIMIRKYKRLQPGRLEYGERSKTE